MFSLSSCYFFTATENLSLHSDNFSQKNALAFCMINEKKKKEVCMTNTIAKKQNNNSSVSFGNVVDTLFQNSLRRFFDDNFWEAEGSLNTGTVPVNVRETEQRYELDVVAPGCRKEDFRISVDDNVLTVSFTHQNKQETNDKTGWSRNEFMQRSFSRSFTLNDTVDINNITAGYTDGILRLILPKNEKAKKQSLSIDVK
jgi:HSP20 family protein